MLSEAITFLTHSVDFYLNLLERIQEMNKFQLTLLFDGTLEYTSRDHRKKVTQSTFLKPILIFLLSGKTCSSFLSLLLHMSR